jgi:virginiamycin B lyase
MRKVAPLLAIWLVVLASPSLAAVEAHAGVRTRTCPDVNTKFEIKRFPINEVLGGLALGPNGNVWFTLVEEDGIGRLTPHGKITYFSEGITDNPEHPVSGAVAPQGITKGPDGNMWFTEHGADRIARVTPDGTITEFSTGITRPSGAAAADLTDAAPSSIITGADGNLWFTEQIADRIGRITPDGVITEFSAGITPSPSQSLPGPHAYQAAQPGPITKGADGNVWFVELLAGRIGRVTPEGVITEFPIPIASPTYPDAYNGLTQYRVVTGVSSITAGPDGNVWFTEFTGGPLLAGYTSLTGVGALGRITPSGEVTEFTAGLTQGPPDTESAFPTTPTPAGLRGIAKGPDGNMWALDVHGLVRITPAGKITEFPLELTIGTFSDEQIVVGPHRTFWFAENVSHDIARVKIGCAKH